MKHREFNFEEEIVKDLLNNRGWVEGISAEYDKELGLYTKDFIEFIKTSEPKAYEKIKKRELKKEIKFSRKETQKLLQKNEDLNQIVYKEKDESIQILIDISYHLVVKYNLGDPKSYSECIELLKKFEYISEKLAEKLIKMVRLRNLLAHEYIKLIPKNF